MEPAVRQRRAGGVVVLVVAEEHGRAPREDLSALADPHLRSGNGFAHGVEADAVVAVDAGDAADLRLPVDLLQAHAHGVEEAEHVGTESGAAGSAAAQIGEAEPILERAEKQPVGEEIENAPQGRYPALLQAQVGDLVTDGHQPLVEETLERRGVHDLHLDGRVEAFPDARRREHDVRTDLADVVQRRLRLLGEIDGEADGQGGGRRHHLLADPGQRQEGDELVVREALVDLREAARHGEQIAEAEHGSLGEAGRAGGVADHRQVFALAARDALGEAGLLHLAAPRLHRLERHQQGMLVSAQSARIGIDHAFDFGQAIDHVEDLVDLFLVLGDDEDGIGMIDDVGNLVEVGVLVEADRGCASGLRSQLRHHPLRPVVAEDGHLVAASEAQADQSERELADGIAILAPGGGVPDAQPLLAQGDLVGMPPGVALQQFGKGVEGGLHHASAPRYASCTSRLPRTRAGSPSAIFLPKLST